MRNIAAELEIDHQIAVLNISVAALMTTRWIARRLEVPAGVDNIVIPGLCEGDVDTLQQATGLPVRKGPADVRSLPEWYGREAIRAELGPRDVRVFAEINDVQSLTREQIVERAEAYRAEGADVIDLGLSLDRSWLTDGPPTIAALRERGLSVSIDTLDAEHIRMADAAGVDYVLSLTPGTIDLAAELRATPVLITEDPDDLDGLGRMAARMDELERPYLLDSILAPINSGFAASLARYVEVRRRHPESEILMGIGNLTELTEADSTGVTALLIGFCQEVGIGAVSDDRGDRVGARSGPRDRAGGADHAPRSAPGTTTQAHRFRPGHQQGRVDARAHGGGDARDAGADLGRQLPPVRRCGLAVRVQRRAVRPRSQHVRRV